MIVVLAFAAIVLSAMIVSPVYRMRFAKHGRILVLHSLERKFADFGAISRTTFDRMIDDCSRLGLRCGTIEEALQRDDTVAITFDDGYDDLMQLLPLIRKRRISITVFVPTAFIGQNNAWDNILLRSRRRHLSAEQIRELSQVGVEFGSHSHSHCDLSRLGDDTVLEELKRSKDILEELTGKQVRYLAYPFGCADERIGKIASKLGYQRGLWSAAQTADHFNVGRTPLSRFDTYLTVKAKLRPGILSGAEYLKSAIISRFSHLTPLLDGFRRR